jgi:hypothetical protein
MPESVDSTNLQKSKCAKGVFIRNRGNQVEEVVMSNADCSEGLSNEGKVVRRVPRYSQTSFETGHNFREGSSRDIAGQGERTRVTVNREDKLSLFWTPS